MGRYTICLTINASCITQIFSISARSHINSTLSTMVSQACIFQRILHSCIYQGLLSLVNALIINLLRTSKYLLIRLNFKLEVASSLTRTSALVVDRDTSVSIGTCGISTFPKIMDIYVDVNWSISLIN